MENKLVFCWVVVGITFPLAAGFLSITVRFHNGMDIQQEPTPQQPAVESAKKRPGPFKQIGTLLRERWPEYILEIVVIILSITLSFAFDEWKEKNRKQEVEQTYLKSLANDVATDVDQLDEVITETKQITQKAGSLGRLTEQQAAASANYNRILSDVRFVFKRPRFIAENATFLDLTSTGNMQLITDASLKKALFNYYRHYTSIEQVESAELEAANTIAGPYVLNRLPLVGGINSKPVDLAAVTGEVEFKNVMVLRQSTREELLSEYEELLEKGKAIQALLKKNLK